MSEPAIPMQPLYPKCWKCGIKAVKPPIEICLKCIIRTHHACPPTKKQQQPASVPVENPPPPPPPPPPPLPPRPRHRHRHRMNTNKPLPPLPTEKEVEKPLPLRPRLSRPTKLPAVCE